MAWRFCIESKFFKFTRTRTTHKLGPAPSQECKLAERVIIALSNPQNGIVHFDPVSSPSKCMIDSMFSLGCCAVSFVPLVAFWVPVMTPAEPPQGRRRPKIRPHFGHFECSGRPREVEWAGPRPCTSLHMSPRSLHRACMAWGRRGGRGHGTRGGQKCQNDQKSERVTDGSRGIFGIATCM